jgi:hypothetical protein
VPGKWQLPVTFRSPIRFKAERMKSVASAGATLTELRLQFSGKDEQPEEIERHNIYEWYAQWNPSITLSPQYPSTVPPAKRTGPTTIYSPPHWTIIVLFNEPIAYHEVVVSFSSPGFGSYEVRKPTDRSVLVNVAGQVPVGVLELYAKP